VPLNQALRSKIADAEAELAHISQDAPSTRMGATSPLKAKAREIEALREQMKASEITFRFRALDDAGRDAVRVAMKGRDDPDEINLRCIAAMCYEPVDAEWTDFRDLRKNIGVNIFDSTIDAAATRASGDDWSVPFSFAASHILGIEK